MPVVVTGCVGTVDPGDLAQLPEGRPVVRLTVRHALQTKRKNAHHATLI